MSTTTAQELRDLDNSPWNMPHYALRMQAADELEAFQKEVFELTAHRDMLKMEFEKLRTQNHELNAEADKEHAKAVELCDKLIEERAQNQELREALQYAYENTLVPAVHERITKALALKP